MLLAVEILPDTLTIACAKNCCRHLFPVFAGLYTSEERISKSSGFFSSPKFPNNFPQYSRCTWNVTVPSRYIIKVSFHHFELGSRSSGAHVTITNVASDDNVQPFYLYGSSLPAPVYSAGNSIEVIFTSLTDQYSGFNASYKAITSKSGMSVILNVSEDQLSPSLEQESPMGILTGRSDPPHP